MRFPRFRLRLRSILILIALAAVALGVWRSWTNWLRVHRDPVTENLWMERGQYGEDVGFDVGEPLTLTLRYLFWFQKDRPPFGLPVRIEIDGRIEEESTGTVVARETFRDLLVAGIRNERGADVTWRPRVPRPGRYQAFFNITLVDPLKRTDQGGGDMGNPIAVLSPEVFAKGRGGLLTTRADYAGALAAFQKAVRINPAYAAGHDGLARFLATCPEAKYRDGKTAVAEATRACELDGGKTAEFVDSLAAAQAEAGDFDAAVRRQQRAIALFPANPGQPWLVDPLKSRLALYESHKPYREGGEDWEPPPVTRADFRRRVAYHSDHERYFSEASQHGIDPSGYNPPKFNGALEAEASAIEPSPDLVRYKGIEAYYQAESAWHRRMRLHYVERAKSAPISAPVDNKKTP
ncbi:MAG TPA: hypothetical protein VG406_20390 [Isosphaeraceae bacterium]|jgi:tetratricopeptide (TPR) repeat protein|nr:hypothetical protein [Isosphaeraceae bacterium]